MRQFICILCCLASAISQTARCDEVGLSFTGEVTISGSPWGFFIPAGSSISGHFIFETSSPQTYVGEGCDCAGYRQLHLNGFQAKFGDVSVTADDYIVEVENDNEFFSADLLSLIFTSFPPLANQLPLRVNDTEQNDGAFRLALSADMSLWDGPELPASLNGGDFTAPPFAQSVSDSPFQEIDVFFSIDSLAATSFTKSDHDLDGDVDGVDFLIWQRSVGPLTQNGDANSDWIADNQDLTHWSEQFGMYSAVSQSFASIPEPSTIVLAALLGIVLPFHTSFLSARKFTAIPKHGYIS